MSQIKVELQATYGGDFEIASSAWTSSLGREAQKKRTDKDIKRVIDLLADQKHSVPFESVIFRWHLTIPIAVDRQLMTHRLQSASGLSGRYRRVPSSYLDVPDDIMDIYNKISSLETDQMINNYYSICDRANTFYQIECEAMKAAADDPIHPLITNEEYKRVREFLRGVLPQHNMTERVSVMNLRSWSNFYKLRSSSHAQPEIQLVAKLMLQAVKESNKIPFALEALERNGWQI
jgi:thymidylate synthase (FAD)